MKLRATLLVTLLAVAVAPATPAAAQKQPKPPKPGTTAAPVSIGVTPNPTVFSTPVTVSGRVEKAGSGVDVTLLARILPGTTFVPVATAKTTNGGAYTFSHRPPRNTYYRVTAAASPPVTSADVLVRVRTLIGFRVSDTTPAAGASVRFSGIVRPRHNGRVAYVQRRSSTGRWVTVRRTTLRSLDAQTSRYSVRISVRRSGTFRVRVLGHDDHAMGISRLRTLTVH